MNLLDDPISASGKWFADNPVVAVWLSAFCLSISATMIIRMWFIYRNVHFIEKLLWSFFLQVPLFGWFFYGGLFQPPGYNSNQCPKEHSSNITSSGGGAF